MRVCVCVCGVLGGVLQLEGFGCFAEASGSRICFSCCLFVFVCLFACLLACLLACLQLEGLGCFCKEQDVTDQVEGEGNLEHSAKRWQGL